MSNSMETQKMAPSLSELKHYLSNADKAPITELDLSSLDTSQEKNLGWLFSGFANLKMLDVSSVDTSAAENMSYMFARCKSLQMLDVSSFHTSQVKDMSCMFYRCQHLKRLDLSGFDFSQNPNMERIFADCTSLSEVIVSDTILRTTCTVKLVERVYPFRDYSGPTETDFDGTVYIPGEGNTPSQAYENRIVLDRNYSREQTTYKCIPFIDATDQQRRAYLGLESTVQLKIVSHRIKGKIDN